MSCFCMLGVTQELIEETRATAETLMLTDLRHKVSNGMDLECRGSSGETSVSSGIQV